MLIAVVVAICVILFVLALFAPRLSRKPQGAVNRGFGARASSRTRARAARSLAAEAVQEFPASR